MEAKQSTHAVLDAVQVQTGCQYGAAGYGLFHLQCNFERTWSGRMGAKMGKVFWKPERSTSSRQPRMHPVSGPAMQEIINQLIADANELKEKVRIESRKLVHALQTLFALERTITCEGRTKNLVRGEFYVK